MTLCVYLIDDDDAIRDSLSALLATVGWHTQPYASIADFEQLAQRLALAARLSAARNGFWRDDTV